MQCFAFVFLQKINFEIYSWLILLFPRSELLFCLQSTTKIVIVWRNMKSRDKIYKNYYLNFFN